MKVISAILNLPWTLIGLLLAVASGTRLVWLKNGAIIFEIHSWWWSGVFPWLKGVRAAAIGNIVLLGPNAEPNDLQHELVHIGQHGRYPLIYPLLHTVETIRFGYRKNRFEDEAHRRAGNVYKTP